MLARKAFGDTAKTYVPQQVINKRKTKRFIMDMSAEMKSLVQILTLVVLCAGIVMSFQALSAKQGYDLVKLQQNVVQLSKDHEVLKVEVATLKSPTRIQKIAQDTLGMVMPSDFVYSSKSAVAERNVQKIQRIVD